MITGDGINKVQTLEAEITILKKEIEELKEFIKSLKTTIHYLINE